MYQGKFDRKNKAPVRDMPQLRGTKAAAPAAAPRARGPRLSGVIFYLLFFLYILIFYIAAYCGLRILRDWLVDFEAAQPTVKCQQVFDDLFAARDWDALYDAAGIRDENRDTFTTYMVSTVGEKELTYMETSAGLSGDRKYNVRMDGEKIASFTLTDKNKASDTELPDWQLSAVEFFFTREEGYLVQKPAGSAAYVNGTALDDSHTVRIRTTKADGYLPEGTAGPRTHTQQVTGLIAKPVVTVLDETGAELTVTYDEESRTFSAQTEAPAIGAEERETALNAVKTYALYMNEKAGASEVAQYFDDSSDTYKAIINTDRSSVQDAQSREFVNESVTGYCRYSDDLFSVRVSITLNLYRTSGTVKENDIAQSLFFQKQNGKWKCIQMTAVDVSQPVETVRLTFMDGNAEISSDFYETDLARLTCPAVTVPEGKVFSGWMVQEQDESGQTVMRLVFQPDQAGLVTLPADTPLEPMTLYPLFEDV